MPSAELLLIKTSICYMIMLRQVIRVKKVVIFGGGTGMSQILKGLKLFPLDITAVVSVCDSGRSTGALREIFDIPAVGDLTKVLMTIGDLSEETRTLLNYRVKGMTGKGDYNHSLKNLLIASLIDIHGSLDKAVEVFNRVFNIKGTVLPLTEENVELVAKMHDGEVIVGENEITDAMKKIKSIWYDRYFTANPRIFAALEEADLIIFSPGSLYTSVLPHLMSPEVTESIKMSKAKKLYISNLITQPGETLGFSVSDHIKILNKYLGSNGIDVVIANKAKISKRLSTKYETREQKHPVVYDEAKLKNMKVEAIGDKIFTIEENYLRHDSLKTAYLVFSYLMRDE